MHDLADETVNAPRARRTRQYCSVAKRWLHGEPKYESLAVFPNADRFR
ncbi:protein of unassigned function [Methylobacterium oryzae CBMB20]|uniref:Protein of unassigned function n=1 Tax=Methylobacterium oryzae CBMB20 TaxID=693986 RepID=A0A089NRU3_9HYPH|nr:protein of unassigned function [Methylobacterium oryzae CBMB20]